MIKAFVLNRLNELNPALFVRLFKIFSLAAIVVIAYAFIFSGFQILDEFEHLHASWLVSLGRLPYRDFIEHHHLTLWYLSAPLVSAFYDDAGIFYVMRGISCAVSFLMLWYVYKTVLFFGNRTCAWAAIALTLGNIITVYNFYQFRPDNFMNCGFVAGLYYWFYYLNSRQTRFLSYAFLAFTVAFLFLQKISLLLGVVQLLILWLMVKRLISVKTVFIAALPSAGILVIFFAFLYQKGIFLEYFEFNLHFNMELVYYMGRGSFWIKNLFSGVYGLALISALFFFRRENISFKILTVLYLAEFLMRAFYLAPHPNYYTLLTILSAMVLSVWFKNEAFKHRVLTLILVLALFLHLGSIFNTVAETSERHNSYTHYQMADYIHKNSTADDVLLNGYDKNFNIYRQDASYYWFSVEMLLPLMKQTYQMGEEYDLNELILQKRPKFLYIADFVDLLALRAYGETRYIQQYNPQLIYLLYQPTPFENLVMLK